MDSRKLRGKKPKEMKWQERERKFSKYTELSESGFYSLKAWIDIRDYVLDNEIYCRMCSKHNILKVADMVDHIKPVNINSSYSELYGLDNLQPLCYTCHRKKTNWDRGKRSFTKLRIGKKIMKDLEE